MKKIISHSLEETRNIANEWLGTITEKYESRGEALMVGLSGHLGAGKTAFVKELAKILGIQEVITSPTFVIMKMYDTTNSRWKRIIHVDAYRLEKPEEIEVLDLNNLKINPDNLILVEWPENVNLSTDEQINMKALEEVGSVEIDMSI